MTCQTEIDEAGFAFGRKIACILLMPLYAPLSISIFFGLTQGTLSWPVADVENAIRLVPKLSVEHAKLIQYFSAESADAYALAFANYLILCFPFMAISSVLVVWMIKRWNWKLTGSANFSQSEPRAVGYWARAKVVAVVAASLSVLAALTFIVPVVYRPSVGISAGRALISFYLASAFFCSGFFMTVSAALILLVMRRSG